MNGLSDKARERLLYLISPIGLLLLWQVLLELGIGDRRFIPAPTDIAVRFWHLLMSGELALQSDDILASAYDEDSVDLIASHLPGDAGSVLVAAADHGRTLVQLIARGFSADAMWTFGVANNNLGIYNTDPPPGDPFRAIATISSSSAASVLSVNAGTPASAQKLLPSSQNGFAPTGNRRPAVAS